MNVIFYDVVYLLAKVHFQDIFSNPQRTKHKIISSDMLGFWFWERRLDGTQFSILKLNTSWLHSFSVANLFKMEAPYERNTL